MASKRKFKRDYIILEAKDTDFRYKDRILPKAFAKVEINDEKSMVSLYVENLKSVKQGYRVVGIQSDYEVLELGNIVLGEQGKGEFVLNLDRNDIEIKGIALLYEKAIPLIGFKGNKIENYEEILFAGDSSYEDEDEYEEYEYIEVDEEYEDEDEYENDEEYEEYEEYEYIEIDEDDEYIDMNNDNEYIEIDEDDENEYIEIDEDDSYIEISEEDEYENDLEQREYIEIGNSVPYRKKAQKRHNKQENNNYIENEYAEIDDYQEYDNVEETIDRNINNSKQESSQYQYTKTAGTLLMPRQIKKNLKYFKEVKPFVRGDVEDTRWWKIEISPASLCGYAMPYLGYVNTLNYTMYSDSVMHSYKYRHYLFGVQYDEYNKRKNYIYAVPGRKNEQPDKGHTGFNTYQACDTRNDSLGYWLCFIDSRTRRILK